MHRPRILYITDNASLRSTTCMLDAWLGELHERVIDAQVVCSKTGPWIEELRSRGVQCHIRALEPVSKWQPIRSLGRVWSLVSLVRQERFEAIHCNEHQHFPLLRYVARLCQIPLMVNLRCAIHHSFAHWAFRLPYTPAAVMFTSKFQQGQAAEHLPANVSIRHQFLLMNGMAIDKFMQRGGQREQLRNAWLKGRNRVVIGTASAVRPWKQLDDFIEVVDRLKSRGLEVIGVIAGGGKGFSDEEYEQQLKAKIDSRGLQDDVLMIGNLDPITSFMQSIDIFISTSRMETFGMSLCEAGACRVPQLTYDGGSQAEVVPDPWCVVPQRDIEQLTEKTDRLVRDEAYRRQLGAKAQTFVDANFDAPILSRRVLQVYAQVLNRTELATALDG